MKKLLCVAALIALPVVGCEKKAEDAGTKVTGAIGDAAKAAGDTASKAADATKDAASKAVDATKDAAAKGAEVVKDAGKQAAASAAAATAEVKTKFIDEMTKSFDGLKTQITDTVKKVDGNPALKTTLQPMVDGVNKKLGEVDGMLKGLKDVGLSEWTSKSGEFSKAFDGLKTMANELMSKLPK